MGLKAMLSVDLSNASADERQRFYDELKARHWEKLTKLTTVWQASFADGVGEQAAIEETKKDLDAAAQKAGIRSYDAVVHPGPSAPTVF